MRRHQVLAPLDWNPIEVWLLGLCVLTGVQNWRQPVAHLPGWALWLWYGLLVAGGAVGVVGALWRDAIMGLVVLRAALIPLGAGAYIWGLTLALATGLGPLGGLVLTTFGMAVHWRAVQITLLLRTHGRPR